MPAHHRLYGWSCAVIMSPSQEGEWKTLGGIKMRPVPPPTARRGVCPQQYPIYRQAAMVPRLCLCARQGSVQPAQGPNPASQP